MVMGDDKLSSNGDDKVLSDGDDDKVLSDGDDGKMRVMVMMIR